MTMRRPRSIASASSRAASPAPFRVAGGSSAREAVVELVGRTHAAAREEPRQQRMHAGLLERPAGARRHVAQPDRVFEGHKASSSGCGAGTRQRCASRDSQGVAFASKRCAWRSPHRLKWKRLAAAQALQRSAERAAVERLPGLDPGGPVLAERRRAQGVVRPARRHAHAPADASRSR